MVKNSTIIIYGILYCVVIVLCWCLFYAPIYGCCPYCDCCECPLCEFCPYRFLGGTDRAYFGNFFLIPGLILCISSLFIKTQTREGSEVRVLDAIKQGLVAGGFCCSVYGCLIGIVGCYIGISDGVLWMIGTEITTLLLISYVGIIILSFIFVLWSMGRKITIILVLFYTIIIILGLYYVYLSY